MLCSLVFFLITSLLPSAHAAHTQARNQINAAGTELIAAGEKLSGDMQTSGLAPDGKLELRVGADAPAWTRRLAERTRGKSAAELGAEISSALRRYMPDAMLVLVPVFALLLKLLFRRRYLTEHVVMALHLNAAGFLWLLLMRLSPSGVVGGVLFLGGLTYLFIAVRRVYEEGWARTVIKSAFAIGAYAVLLAVTVSAVAIVGMTFA